jgi:phosphoribosylformimino-5-aminoimidazole carboxamide ribotide isomerase
MKIIPVMDLRGGHVVRGIAGRRDEYRPMISQLTPSSVPLNVARAIRDRFGLHHFYIADLDAIAGESADVTTLATLRDHGFHCWVDAGIRTFAQAITLAPHVAVVIAGLETLAGPGELDKIVHALGRDVIFSLDLKAGTPMGNLVAWRNAGAFAIAQQAISFGLERLLVLDVGRVGTGTGTGTGELCSCIIAKFPLVEVLTGGGIRDMVEIRRLEAIGVAGVLVASGLHDGTLMPAG